MRIQEMKDTDLDTAVALALEYTIRELEVTKARAYFDDKGRFVSTVKDWKPSEDWSQGGPLIQYYQIDLKYKTNGEATASVFYRREGTHQSVWVAWDHSETLRAAMRALVVSRLGYETKLPGEP